MIAESSLTDRMPASNTEAERALLGSVLMLPILLDDVCLIVSPADFYNPSNRTIYGLLLELHNGNKSIDAVVIANAAKKIGRYEDIGGAVYLADLLNSVATPAHAVHYAEMVRDEAIKRDLMHASTEVLRDSYRREIDAREQLNKAEEAVMSIRDRRSVMASHAVDSHELMTAAMDELAVRMEAGRRRGFDTGFVDLDDLVEFRPSDLIILAARPSMGKTALAANIAVGACKLGTPTLIFSLEMPRIQLADRLLSSEGSVDGKHMSEGRLNPTERHSLVEACAAIAKLPLTVDDSPIIRINEICAVARRAKRKNGIGLIVVDYLQLIQADDTRAPREQQVAILSKRLKGLARELNVTVLCLAQLNRQTETATENKPRLNHLRESGSIEADADVVMFVHRPEYYEKNESNKRALAGKAEVLVEKNRSGPTGVVALTWIKEFVTFRNAAKSWSQDADNFSPVNGDF